jgi:hypothetical protein
MGKSQKLHRIVIPQKEWIPEPHPEGPGRQGHHGQQDKGLLQAADVLLADHGGSGIRVGI